MMSALMLLAAHTCKSCAAYTVFAVIIIHRQIRVSGFVMESFGTVPGYAPYLVFPLSILLPHCKITYGPFSHSNIPQSIPAPLISISVAGVFVEFIGCFAVAILLPFNIIILLLCG